MSRNYKFLKLGLTITTIIFFILLIIFTIDVINDEPNWAWFEINFDSDKVANYSTLISGLLSFLAIMFVIFNIIEQREQIEKEKKLKEQEVIDDYKSRLELLKSLLIKIASEIKEQGERMREYYELELAQPTQPNTTYFSANKSFNRILEMDYLMNYKSIQYYFKDEEDWEKMFLNLNSNVDFYSEALIEHRQKYQYHTTDKFNRHKEISELCTEFLDSSVKIIENYRHDFGDNEYLNKEWAFTFNEFVLSYYKYAEECSTNQEPTNFKTLSENFFLDFIKKAMRLRAEIGFEDYGSENQVALAAKIRKRIGEIEMFSTQYANDIKYYYDEYFDENCESFKSLQTIVSKIDEKLKNI